MVRARHDTAPVGGGSPHTRIASGDDSPRAGARARGGAPCRVTRYFGGPTRSWHCEHSLSRRTLCCIVRVGSVE